MSVHADCAGPPGRFPRNDIRFACDPGPTVVVVRIEDAGGRTVISSDVSSREVLPHSTS